MPGPTRQQTVSIRATRLWSSTWPSTIGFCGWSRQHLRPRTQVSGPRMSLTQIWKGGRQLWMPDECAKRGAQPHSSAESCSTRWPTSGHRARATQSEVAPPCVLAHAAEAQRGPCARSASQGPCLLGRLGPRSRQSASAGSRR